MSFIYLFWRTCPESMHMHEPIWIVGGEVGNSIPAVEN